MFSFSFSRRGDRSPGREFLCELKDPAAARSENQGLHHQGGHTESSYVSVYSKMFLSRNAIGRRVAPRPQEK